MDGGTASKLPPPSSPYLCRRGGWHATYRSMKNKTCQMGVSSLSANIQHVTLGSIGNTPIAHPQVAKGMKNSVTGQRMMMMVMMMMISDILYLHSLT